MKAISESGKIHIVTLVKEPEYRTMCGSVMIVYEEDKRPEDAVLTCKRCKREMEKGGGEK